MPTTLPSVAQTIRQLEAGFPFSAIARFSRELTLPLSRVSELLRIPPRTLARRRQAGKLSLEESERLLRLSRIYKQAMELFEGEKDEARTWLTTPKRALDNQSPLDFSRTEIGAREVEVMIGRLAHGVFS